MKLPITDEFLWDLYKLLDKTGDVLHFVFNGRNALKNMFFEQPTFRKYRKDKNKAQFNKLIYYLKINNYIQIKNLKGKKALMLTKDGISKALKAGFKVDGKRKRKDGKWIMLTFDVPVKYKKARVLLRSILHNLEYKMFQQSIWITPYDVSEKTEKLLQIYGLDEYVRIFLIEEL